VCKPAAVGLLEAGVGSLGFELSKYG